MVYLTMVKVDLHLITWTDTQILKVILSSWLAIVKRAAQRGDTDSVSKVMCGTQCYWTSNTHKPNSSSIGHFQSQNSLLVWLCLVLKNGHLSYRNQAYSWCVLRQSTIVHVLLLKTFTENFFFWYFWKEMTKFLENIK